MYIDNQVSTFCVLSPLNLSIFKFDAVLKILKFWLVPDESGVAPEVVGIGSGAVGTELGGGTNLMMDGLLNDCGVLSGVPGVADDVDWSAWCRSIGGLGTNLCRTGVDVVTDAGEVLEANGIVALSAPSNVLCWSVVNRSSSDNSSSGWWGVLEMSWMSLLYHCFVVWWSGSLFHVLYHLLYWFLGFKRYCKCWKVQG